MARRTNVLKMTATKYKKKAKNAATQAVYMGLITDTYGISDEGVVF